MVKKNYSLVGVDGNAFSVLGYVQEALRNEKLYDKVEAYYDEAISGDYNHLIAVSCDWLEKLNSKELQRKEEVVSNDEEEHNEAYKNNQKLVQEFLKENNLPDEAILTLEVFGQISDGEFEDCHDYQMDWDWCINELKEKYPNWKDYQNIDLQEKWDHSEQRHNLDFSPEGDDVNEFELDNLNIREGYTASILPPSIKNDVLDTIENNISEIEDEDEDEYYEDEEDEDDEE